VRRQLIVRKPERQPLEDRFAQTAQSTIDHPQILPRRALKHQSTRPTDTRQPTTALLLPRIATALDQQRPLRQV
jgi:hypothetical protein